jgi:hypothetical protein
MVNQAKLKSFNNAPKLKNGYKIPQTYEPAMQFDMKNGNTKWQDAIALELQQINEYETFTDVGHHTQAKIPNGYKNIRVHFVFDAKHGQLTEVPLESFYSGVVSLRGFRLVLFLAELNKLEL